MTSTSGTASLHSPLVLSVRRASSSVNQRFECPELMAKPT